MHGNYRRNYLFAGSTGSATAATATAAANASKLQSHPSDPNRANDPIGHKSAPFISMQQHKQQQQHLLTQTQVNRNLGHLSTTALQQQQYCAQSTRKMLGNEMHNYVGGGGNNDDDDDDCSQLDADQYASQLRNLSIQSRSVDVERQHKQQSRYLQPSQMFGSPVRTNGLISTSPQKWTTSKCQFEQSSGHSQLQQQQMHSTPTNKSQDQTKCHQQSSNQSTLANGSIRHQSSHATGASSSTPNQSTSLRVNFNRSNRNDDDDDDNEQQGESRKKKYLTAKYGQQQMNLIKKRLKIETWLHEQLQELAKSINAEAELDEIDIDLDQLLDMENDETRQRWLKKTLQPLDRLPPEKLDKFIDEVLEQSRLL